MEDRAYMYNQSVLPQSWCMIQFMLFSVSSYCNSGIVVCSLGDAERCLRPEESTIELCTTSKVTTSVASFELHTIHACTPVALTLGWDLDSYSKSHPWLTLGADKWLNALDKAIHPIACRQSHRIISRTFKQSGFKKVVLSGPNFHTPRMSTKPFLKMTISLLYWGSNQVFLDTRILFLRRPELIALLKYNQKLPGVQA